jgi:hypothetical protein
MAICRERGYAPSRVLILLAFGSLLGGQWTLIGTRSNLILSDYLRERTGTGLGFFAFTPIALCGVRRLRLVVRALVGRRSLPAATANHPGEPLRGRRVPDRDDGGPGFGLRRPHAGRTRPARPRRHGAAGDPRPPEFLPRTRRHLRIQAGDVLVIQGRITAITDVLQQRACQREGRTAHRRQDAAFGRPAHGRGDPATRQRSLGRSLRELDFHRRYGSARWRSAALGVRSANGRSPNRCARRFAAAGRARGRIAAVAAESQPDAAGVAPAADCAAHADLDRVGIDGGDGAVRSYWPAGAGGGHPIGGDGRSVDGLRRHAHGLRKARPAGNCHRRRDDSVWRGLAKHRYGAMGGGGGGGGFRGSSPEVLLAWCWPSRSC